MLRVDALRRNPTPGEQVVTSLRRSKRNGRDFDSAWTAAMRRILWSKIDSKMERDDWKKALASNEIRAELRACYLDEPTPVGDRLGAWQDRDRTDPEVRLLA